MVKQTNYRIKYETPMEAQSNLLSCAAWLVATGEETKGKDILIISSSRFSAEYTMQMLKIAKQKLFPTDDVGHLTWISSAHHTTWKNGTNVFQHIPLTGSPVSFKIKGTHVDYVLIDESLMSIPYKEYVSTLLPVITKKKGMILSFTCKNRKSRKNEQKIDSWTQIFGIDVDSIEDIRGVYVETKTVKK